MNLDKYTQKSQEALLAAQRLAQDYQHQVVEPIHLLLALVQQQEGIVRAIITKVSGGTQAIQQELSNELEKKPRVQGANLDVSLSSQTAEVLSAAERYAKVYNIDYNRCIFCGYCVEACPTDAITHGHGFEVASFNTSTLIYRKERLLEPSPADKSTA